MSQYQSISSLAREIVMFNRDSEQQERFGCVSLSDYTPEQQIALLLMQFNKSDLAQAVLLKLKHSTVVGMDFAGLVDKGLAIREHGARYHSFTPRGRYVAGRITQLLAAEFGIKPQPQTRVNYRTPAHKRRDEAARYNWANR
jgi:hypothetical protein